jgi:hypothetical protein
VYNRQVASRVQQSKEREKAVLERYSRVHHALYCRKKICVNYSGSCVLVCCIHAWDVTLCCLIAFDLILSDRMVWFIVIRSQNDTILHYNILLCNSPFASSSLDLTFPVLFLCKLILSHPPLLLSLSPRSTELRCLNSVDLSSLNFKEQHSYQLYFNLWKAEVKMDLLASRLKVVAQNVFLRTCFHRWKRQGRGRDSIDLSLCGSLGISASVSASVSTLSDGHLEEDEEKDEKEEDLMGLGVDNQSSTSSNREDNDEEEEEFYQDYCDEKYEDDFILPLPLPLYTLDQNIGSVKAVPRPSDSRNKRVSFLDDKPLLYEEKGRDGMRDEGGRDGEGDEGEETEGERDEVDADEGTDNGHTLLRSFDCTHRLTAAEIQVIREEIDGKDVCLPDQTDNTFTEENNLLKVNTVSELQELEGGEEKGGEFKGGEGKDEVEGGGKGGGEAKGEEKEEGDQPTDVEAEKLKMKAEKKVKREKSERRRSRINRAINCQMSFGNKDIYF